MKRIDRLDAIRRVLEERGIATIESLSSVLGVSSSSVRRDIAWFAAMPQFRGIRRIHGGLSLDRPELEPQFEQKLSVNGELKLAVAKAALKYVGDGDSILIDSGTTCFLFAGLLRKLRGLRVVTTDLKVAEELGANGAIETNIVGGVVRPGYYTIGGSDAEAELERFSPGKVFMSIDALDMDYGITNAAEFEVGVKRRLLRYGSRVHILADSTKFDRRALYWVSELPKIGALVVDEALEPRTVDRLRRAGVRLELAPLGPKGG